MARTMNCPRWTCRTFGFVFDVLTLLGQFNSMFNGSILPLCSEKLDQSRVMFDLFPSSDIVCSIAIRKSENLLLFPSGNKRTIAIKIVCFKLQLERIKLDCNTKPHISIRPTCVGRQIIVHCCEASLLSSHSKAIIHVAPAFTGPFTNQINYFHRNENFCCKKFNVFVGTSAAANKGRDFSCSWQSLEKGALR